METKLKKIKKYDYISVIKTVLLRQVKLHKCTAFEMRPDAKRSAIFQKLLKWGWIEIVTRKNGYCFVRGTKKLLNMKVDFNIALDKNE